MKYRLPFRLAFCLAVVPAALAGLAVLGQTPIDLPAAPPAVVPLPELEAAAQPLPRPDADVLLDQTTTMLSRRRSISAKLRHQAELFGRTIVGAGDYAQGPASSRLMRYEVRMQIGERTVHQLQVNDGRYLWQQRQYQDTAELERIEVDRVLAAGQGGAVGGDALAVLGLGGLGRLLTTLRKDFEFLKVFRSELDKVPVYGIEGHWRPEVLQKLGVDSAKKLRAHVPDRVVVYLGCDDFFPYRIEFLRERPAVQKDAPPQIRPLLVLELFDLRFDVPLDDAQFRFNAGSQPFVDVTDRAATLNTSVP